MVHIKEDARIMADLLKSGHKMLSLSCPICNNPLFQNKSGTTFCAICNREVLLVDKDSNKNDVALKPTVNNPLEITNLDSEIKSVIIEKINWIAHKLENETQLHIVNEYLELILNLLKILEKLKSLKLS
ncbi:MAG: Sjogren's syndrome/scleroderma autoantigen 1 family protein [Promethearchaeota archaeon]